MKIVLLCNWGMSTSMLVNKMKAEIQSRNIEATIEAKPFEDLDKVIEGYDVILLGPQVKFKEKTVAEHCKDGGPKYGVIPAQIYGMIDGKKAVDFALEIFSK